METSRAKTGRSSKSLTAKGLSRRRRLCRKNRSPPLFCRFNRFHLTVAVAADESWFIPPAPGGRIGLARPERHRRAPLRLTLVQTSRPWTSRQSPGEPYAEAEGLAYRNLAS